jgi:hypothetical protein
MASPELDPVTGNQLWDATLGKPATYYYPATSSDLRTVFAQIAQSIITHAALVPVPAG